MGLVQQLLADKKAQIDATKAEKLAKAEQDAANDHALFDSIDAANSSDMANEFQRGKESMGDGSGKLYDQAELDQKVEAAVKAERDLTDGKIAEAVKQAKIQILAKIKTAKVDDEAAKVDNEALIAELETEVSI